MSEEDRLRVEAVLSRLSDRSDLTREELNLLRKGLEQAAVKYATIDNHEMRIRRIEGGIIGFLVAATVLLGRIVMKSSGIEL
jgi:hypothetical protein